jgi:hypothetical protein
MSVETSLHALKQKEHALKRKKINEASSGVKIAGLHRTYRGEYKK